VISRIVDIVNILSDTCIIIDIPRSYCCLLRGAYAMQPVLLLLNIISCK